MPVVSTPAEVLPYKLFAPPPYPGAIYREELLGRMLREPRYRLVMVQAPAGHGKSTLLQQAKTLSEQQGALTAWLSFDEADNDMRRFTLYLEALLSSLRHPEPSLGERMTLERQRLSEQMNSALTQLRVPVHLFLDELQSLTERGVLKVFREFLDHVPDNVTVFIGSRSEPEIGLARLLVNNQALVLRADDLRFSPTEAERFFSQARDLGINPNELEIIYQQTEGWPAALQLYRLSLASPAVRRSLANLRSYKPRELAEYLADNVLTLQTPRVQEFLRRSSVLTRLSAPLCDYVNGWQDSQSILLFLERSGLFLRSLDSDLCWFRYHTLFSSFLAEQLRSESPETLLEIHQRAADWFFAHAHHEDALHHAVAARNYPLATEILEVWAQRLIIRGELATLERWTDALPLHEIARRPALAIKTAWPLIFLRRQHKLRPILASLEDSNANAGTDVIRAMLAVVNDEMPQAFAICETIELRDPQAQSFRLFELGAAANLVGYRQLCAGDFDAVQATLALAHSHSERGDALFSSGYAVAVGGMSLLLQGRLAEALTQYQARFAAHLLDRDKSFAAASLVACYVHALYESGDLDQAEGMFTQFRDFICNSVLLDFLAVGYLAMARVQDRREHPDRAEQVLAEADQLAHTVGWPRLARIVAWERVRRALMAGEVDRARAIASRIPRQPEFNLPEGWMTYAQAIEGDAIGNIRLALHGGQLEAAAAQLHQELTLAQRSGRKYRQIKLLVLEALVHHLRGHDNPARRSLRRALQLAEPAGFVSVFLDEGSRLLPLLRQEYSALERESAADPAAATLQRFVQQLLDGSGRSLPPAAAPRPAGDAGLQSVEPLTDREKEILVYLANGVSNKEMARRIFVSENTIKFHLKNIYSKLAVGSRLQAINAARHLGLLEA